MSVNAMHRNVLAWLAANPHDYDSLAAGPLGEALTRAELRDLADDPESIPRLVADINALIARSEEHR